MRRLVLRLLIINFIVMGVLAAVSMELAPVLRRAEWDVVALYNQVDSRILIVDVTRALTFPLTAANADASQPRWSPDGRYLAVTRSVYDNDSPYSLRVYVMDLFSGQSRRISLDGGQGWNPVWSPDGKHIAYSGYRDRTVGRATVYIASVAGELVSDFSNSLSTLNTFAQAWSLSGQYVFVLAYNYRTEEWGVYRLDAFSGESALVQDGYYHSALSPDGRYLALYNQNDEEGILLLDLQSGDLRELTAFGDYPAWSADSRRILFLDMTGSTLYTAVVDNGAVQPYDFDLPDDSAYTTTVHISWRP